MKKYLGLPKQRTKEQRKNEDNTNIHTQNDPKGTN